MPFAWYMTLLLVAGACALGDQIMRGFSRRGFAAASALALFGGILGWGLGYGLNLPEILPLRVDGQPFPLMWTFLGAVTTLGSLDYVIKRNQRKPPRPLREILNDSSSTRT